MKTKTVYMAASGGNQVPFSSYKSMVAYFKASGNLFDSVLNDVKFYKLVITEINNPLNLKK